MDVLLRKDKGKSGVAGYWWDYDGEVLRVPAELAGELLALKGAGFSLVQDESELDPVPDGSLAQILTWVGAVPERAHRALAVEMEKKGLARITVVDKLKSLINELEK